MSVARPRVHHENRVTTAVRLPESLHLRLKAAADDRDVSVNLLVTKALEDYLDRLVPADEILATRPTAWGREARTA
jgi:predicted transcriptional regulator